MSKNNTFLFKLGQGFISGLNLAFLFENLSAFDFAFLTSQGSAMMALGIVDLGIGVRFVNLNISYKFSKEANSEKTQNRIFGIQHFTKYSLLISLILTGISVPLSMYFSEKYRVILDFKTICLIAITTFIFLVGNFVFRFYLVLNSLLRLVKLQLISSMIQFVLSVLIFYLDYNAILNVYLLGIPNAILIADLIFLQNKHLSVFFTGKESKSKFDFSPSMQLVQVTQAAIIIIISIAIAKHLTDLDAAFSSFMQRASSTLLAAMGMSFIQNWIDLRSKNPFNVFILRNNNWVTRYDFINRKKTLISAFSVFCIASCFILWHMGIAIVLQLSTAMWILVVITQLAYWTEYFDFLKREKYLELFMSSLIGLITIISTLLLVNRGGLLLPPLLYIISQMVSYLSLYLIRMKNQK